MVSKREDAKGGISEKHRLESKLKIRQPDKGGIAHHVLVTGPPQGDAGKCYL